MSTGPDPALCLLADFLFYQHGLGQVPSVKFRRIFLKTGGKISVCNEILTLRLFGSYKSKNGTLNHGVHSEDTKDAAGFTTWIQKSKNAIPVADDE